MSNREIDRKIAELMGMRPFEYVLWNGDVDYRVQSTLSEVQTDPVPYFSSDWNAMRLLVEWLQDKKLRVELDFLFKDEATVQLSQLKGYGWSVIIEYASNYAETAPLALCNAVLALPTELLGPKAIESNE